MLLIIIFFTYSKKNNISLVTKWPLYISVGMSRVTVGKSWTTIGKSWTTVDKSRATVGKSRTTVGKSRTIGSLNLYKKCMINH